MFLSETKTSFKGKTVLLRIDADVDLRKEKGKLVVDEDFRLKTALPTIHFLKEKGGKRIILLGHLGRPKGKRIKELSLKPVANWFSQNLEKCHFFDLREKPKGSLCLLENLRFYPGEEGNDPEFIQQLVSLGDVFVNDAFGNCHRRHASIVGLPRFLPSFLGLRVEGEMKTLSWLKRIAPRPLVFVLGGSKSDKIGYLPFLSQWSDKLLIGGKLPLLMKKEERERMSDKTVIASLKKNQKDIDEQSIEKFKKEIGKAKTIVWAGPMGVYEEKTNQKGTMAIAQAIAKSKAFKIAGGGDTHRVISWARLWGQFNFVSVGGGAMLQFLRDETLPGIKVIKKKS